MRFGLSGVVAGVGLLLVGVAAPLPGHHNAAGFDTTKRVKLHGSVTRVEWINPHAWIHIAVKTANGVTEAWRVETATPGLLLRRGLTKESLSVGT